MKELLNTCDISHLRMCHSEGTLNGAPCQGPPPSPALGTQKKFESRLVRADTETSKILQ